MNPYPIHPMHYVFGASTHCPTVLRFWVNEPFTYQFRFLLTYLAIAVAAGMHTGSWSAGVEIFCMFLFAIGLLTVPAAMFDSDDSIIKSLTRNYGTCILAFHGFLLTYFVIYTLVLNVAVAFGFWTLSLNASLLGLSVALLIGYGLLPVYVRNPHMSFSLIPISSLAGFAATYLALK
ncbi:hypothetical protein ACYPKM_03365 [Pseudomonas aeruginosa]